MTKTCNGTASAAVPAAAEATEEEECDGCDGADPQFRMDKSLLRLADGILLRSIIAMTVLRCGGGGVWQLRRHRCLRSTSPCCSLGRRIGRVTTAAASGRRMMRDFLEVVLRQLWEGRFGRRRTTTKMMETSRDDKHEEDVVCEDEPSSSLSTVRLKRQSLETTAARASGADPSRTKRSRTG
jgi:hypothetical protein